jgi:hypothetical protein
VRVGDHSFPIPFFPELIYREKEQNAIFITSLYSHPLGAPAVSKIIE